MVPTFSSYPTGTILLRIKTVCSKRMRRLISISVKGELKPKFDTFLYCSFKKSDTYKIKFRWLFVSVALLFFDNLVLS